ncbi:MAG: T9SS type A sorting domain-containing protein, partial [Ignavibacterium sp.]
PPFNIWLNGSTLSGSHDQPNMIIDIYRAKLSESSASAYEWLGSTTTNSNGNFLFNISDPTVQAVSVAASDSVALKTSAFIKFNLVTSVENDSKIPTEFSLEQNYPNPFNPSTTIRYALPNESKVTITIYNLLGQQIKEIVNDIQSAGYHETIFDASNLSSGVYLYKINARDLVGEKDFS